MFLKKNYLIEYLFYRISIQQVAFVKGHVLPRDSFHPLQSDGFPVRSVDAVRKIINCNDFISDIEQFYYAVTSNVTGTASNQHRMKLRHPVPQK